MYTRVSLLKISGLIDHSAKFNGQNLSDKVISNQLKIPVF